MSQHPTEIEPHDRGLAFDLDTIARRRVERRRALAWMAGAGTTALLAGCGGGGGSSTSGAGTTAGTSTSTSSTSSSTSSTGGTTGSTGSTSSGGQSGQCVGDPTETNGPYPADGTNTASGLTSNALTASGIVRSDIRSSFLGTSTATAAGTVVTFTITVVNTSNSCAPLAGYAVYLWHCNATGLYSLYDLPQESYLRGVQVTDANGQVTFTTVFPGCYAGRYPHIHFEVFTSLSAATSGRNARLVSQFAMPSAACTAIYASSAYGSSASRFAGTSIASDNVFGDNSAAQIAAQTPAFTAGGSGYTATATVGIAG